MHTLQNSRVYTSIHSSRFHAPRVFNPLRAFSVYVPPPQVEHNIVQTQKSIPIVNAPPLLTIDYKEFINLLEHNGVKSVEITKNSNNVQITTSNGKTTDLDIPEGKSIEFMNKVQKYDVDVTYKNNPFTNIPELILQFAIYASLILFVFSFITQRRSISDFSQSNAQENPDTGVTFDDVAGLKNAKRDLQEIVAFLKHPERFTKLGAKVPKGALLIGSPGCGKTLLAKSVAGEAGVPFFSCSASEMVQMFVGVGASRIRDLFAKASKKAPSIIFIDEIDAIGKARTGLNSFSSNDEREQTINQLLTEMDGFKTNTGVIVLAATNRVDVLDPALLRPGRFDRQIQVDLPDFKDRIEILHVHTKNKPLVNDVNLESIAKQTTGFSGADLANLANEAAIIAARNEKDAISYDDFLHALDKITMGERRDIKVSDEKKKITAYHEAGHAIIALATGLYDNVRTVSIVPRGKTGGVTIFEPKDSDVDSGLFTREYLENQIAVALGGRVAEEIVFGYDQITTGASSDIQLVQNIARHMVTHYGLSQSLGAIAWHDGNSSYSESIQSEIDHEVKSIVTRIYKKTTNIMLHHRKYLDAIAQALIEQEVISGNELKAIVTGI